MRSLRALADWPAARSILSRIGGSKVGEKGTLDEKAVGELQEIRRSKNKSQSNGYRRDDSPSYDSQQSKIFGARSTKHLSRPLNGI